MIRYRFVIPNWQGRRIVGPWIKDVPYFILQACEVWINRGVTFTVEIDNQ